MKIKDCKYKSQKKNVHKVEYIFFDNKIPTESIFLGNFYIDALVKYELKLKYSSLAVQGFVINNFTYLGERI